MNKIAGTPSQECACFSCGAESQDALLERIGELARSYRGREGSLIQVLHMAQGIYGYLPLEVQQVVADSLDIPLAEVSGVVSFYSFFSTPVSYTHLLPPQRGPRPEE